MGKAYYIENGTVRDIRKIYVGVNNKARIIRKGYVGVNGVAQLIFGLDLVPIPTIAGTYIYDGTEQTANIVNYNENFMTRTGIYKATNAGTYQVTFTLTHEDSAWADGSSDPITLSWTINKQTVREPVLRTKVYEYTAQTYTPEFQSYPPFDSNIMVISGEIEAVNAGVHTFYISFIEPMNYKWDGRVGSWESEPAVYYWTIERADLDVPVIVEDTFNYDGTQKTVQFTGFNDNLMRKTGTHSATARGTYLAYIELKDTNNFMWDTNSNAIDIEPKMYPWNIIKAAGNISVSPNSVTLYGTTDKVTVTITGSSNDPNAYTVENSNPSICHCSTIWYNDGLKIQIGGVQYGYGTATVKITLNETSAYTAASANITVKVV